MDLVLSKFGFFILLKTSSILIGIASLISILIIRVVFLLNTLIRIAFMISILIAIVLRVLRFLLLRRLPIKRCFPILLWTKMSPGALQYPFAYWNQINCSFYLSNINKISTDCILTLLSSFNFYWPLIRILLAKCLFESCL